MLLSSGLVEIVLDIVMFQSASIVVHSISNLLAMRETWVLFLGQEDPLEKEMATNSSILNWRISWTKEPGHKSRTQFSD